jgi:hypothetical protein
VPLSISVVTSWHAISQARLGDDLISGSVALENDYIRNGVYDNYFRVLSCVDSDSKYFLKDNTPAYIGSTFHLPCYGNRFLQVGVHGNIWSTIIMEILTGKRFGGFLDTTELSKDGKIVKAGGYFSNVTDGNDAPITVDQPFNLPLTKEGHVITKGKYTTSKGGVIVYEFEVLTPLLRGVPDQINPAASRVEIKVKRKVDGATRWRESILIFVQDLPSMRHNSIIAKAIKGKVEGIPVYSLNTRARLENAKISFSTSNERVLFDMFIEGEIGGYLPGYATRLRDGRLVYGAYFFIQLMHSLLGKNEFITSSRHLSHLFGNFYPSGQMDRGNAWEALSSEEFGLTQLLLQDENGKGNREVAVFGRSLPALRTLKENAEVAIERKIAASKQVAEMIVGGGLKSCLQARGGIWHEPASINEVQHYWLQVLATFHELKVLPRSLVDGLKKQVASSQALSRLGTDLIKLGMVRGSKLADLWKTVQHVWMTAWQDQITTQIAGMNGITKSDANAFVTATTWNVNTDPVARDVEREYRSSCTRHHADEPLPKGLGSRKMDFRRPCFVDPQRRRARLRPTIPRCPDRCGVQGGNSRHKFEGKARRRLALCPHHVSRAT